MQLDGISRRVRIKVRNGEADLWKEEGSHELRAVNSERNKFSPRVIWNKNQYIYIYRNVFKLEVLERDALHWWKASRLII